MKQQSLYLALPRLKHSLISLSAIALFILSPILVSSSSAESQMPGTYNLEASSNDKGAIFPSGSVTVQEGMRQSFIFHAAANHHIADVIVDGTSVGPINAFSFENIDGAHTIQAIFEIDSSPITASAGE